jgi:hypothetical protein
VAHQLDLFADSLPVQRANALIDALTRFDRTASRQALQALASINPDHSGLPSFKVLCEFVTNWPGAGDGSGISMTPGTPAAIAAAERFISETIVPAAAIMGDGRRTWLRSCWSDLARWSKAAGVGPEQADCFAAELYLRAQQAGDAVRTASDIPGADRRPAVQRWLGLGFSRCGDAESARRAVLRYAWLAPQRFNSLVGEVSDPELTRDWRAFQGDLGDLDATWFPAWCAHEKKGGVTIVDNVPPGDGPLAYRLVVGLIIRERGGLCAAVYEDRKRLKRLDDNFFAFYMSHRSDPAPRR